MKVMNTKDLAVDGRRLLVTHYNMAFQGHQRGDFDLIEWVGSPTPGASGWAPVTKGTARTLADAVAQAKSFLATN